MATAEQIKALLESHSNRDDQRFYSVVLQVAAREAQQGHLDLATDIEKLVEKSQKSIHAGLTSKPAPLVSHPKGELSGLLELTHPSVRLGDLVLSDEIRGRVDQILQEQRQKDKLAKFSLRPHRKLLLTGSPGTGKTMSAGVLATELQLPLYTIALDRLISRFMGNTEAKLRLIFDHIDQTRAVYLFDEIDAAGAQQHSQNDADEVRRAVSAFMQFVAQDTSACIIVAATNHPEMLDKAHYCLFDDTVRFEKPGQVEIKIMIENYLAAFDIQKMHWPEITYLAEGLSAAEVIRVCEDAAKDAVLNHDTLMSSALILKALERRKATN